MSEFASNWDIPCWVEGYIQLLYTEVKENFRRRAFSYITALKDGVLRKFLIKNGRKVSETDRPPK